MIGFLHPEWLLCALPAAWVLWRCRGGGAAVLLLRALVAAALVLALASPYLERGATGRDLIVVLDRSRSMPPGGEAQALELIRLAEQERRRGDRIGVVGFGAAPSVERLPSGTDEFAGFARHVDADGSDLAGALETALELCGDGRNASIVVVSDGARNGRDPIDVARRALARGVRVDVRATPRTGAFDVSIDSLDLPEAVDAGEPFQFSAWVRSDERVEASFELERDGATIASGRRVFEPGLNRLLFRDRLDEVGIGAYTLRVEAPGDRVRENDRGLGALRVAGPRALLVVNDDGADDSLVQALRAAGLPVLARTPETARLDRLALERFRGVILENVDAGRLGPVALRALREFVTERGGGLLLTGGRSSFATGGYYLSAIDELLPVSMEQRQERRKQGVAMAIVMDRSGSMAVEVAGGVAKMDLANLGAAAAIDLLSPLDSVGVIAVDSSEHVIQDLTRVVDPGSIASRVKRIRSMGGGIFVRTGLEAAERMLRDAEQRNRHVVLFSDAADSEEQGGCLDLAQRFVAANTTLSVIALGTEADTDAQFLHALAARGQGEIYFTTDPTELPRLFAQDTMMVARSTFIEEPTSSRALPDLFGMGELPALFRGGGLPVLGGYNLTYLREGGVAGIVTLDEYKAPLFAFAYRGLGRTAAYTGQIGGSWGGPLVAWEGFSPFVVTLARWLIGNASPDAFFASVRREGREAIVAVEIDPEATAPVDTGGLAARLSRADGSTEELVLERVSEHRFEARTTLDREGIALGAVRIDDERLVPLPPLALPYSPEFERGADPEEGARLLAELARATGGEVGVSAGELFRGPRAARAWRLVTRELLWFALALLVLEIAVRRLELLASVRWPARWRGAWGRATSSLRAALRRAPASRRRAPQSRRAAPPAADEPPVEEPAASPEPEPERSSSLSALAEARERARRRTQR